MSLRMKNARRFLALFVAVFLVANLAGFAQTTAPRARKAASAPAQPVNVNQATAEQLTSLPGIGPAMAKRIVDFRQKNGPFKKVEDLLSVRGIGEKKLEQIKTHIAL